MKASIIFLLLFSNCIAQIVDTEFETEINSHFQERDYKICVDKGVEYFLKYGTDSLKYYLSKSNQLLSNYDSENLQELEYSISNSIRLVPKIIPEYAIYIGTAQVAFWMMYKNTLTNSDKAAIMNFINGLFQNASELIPNDSNKVLADLYLKTAGLYNYYGDLASERKLILDAYKLDSNNKQTALEVAKYFEKEGKIDSCEIVLKKTFNNLEAGETKAQNVYEFIGDQLSNKELKINYYTLALDYENKDASVIYQKLADIYRFSNYRKAIELYSKAIKLNPNDTDNNQMYLDIGWLYSLENDYKNAIKWYTKFKNWDDLNNWDLELYGRSLADCYFELNDYSNALRFYKISNSFSRIARCYIELKEYRQAITYIELSIEETNTWQWMEKAWKDETLSYDYYRLGICYVELEEYANAFEAFEKSYFLDPNNLDAKFNMEWYKITKDNENWVPITYNDDKMYLVDYSRLTKENKIIKVWVKTVLFPHSKMLSELRKSLTKERNSNSDDYNNYLYSLNLSEFNCNKHLVKTTRVIEYTEDGNVINNFKLEQAEWEEIIPESIGETIETTICNKK